MKKHILLFSALAIFATSCENAPEADEAATTDAQLVEADNTVTHRADLTASKVEFIGTKPVGKHHGVIQLKSGEMNATAETLEGGKFVIDMSTLKTDDMDEEGNGKLTGHLKSEDFFDVANHPEATFVITQVVPEVTLDIKDLVMQDATHTITGNLTMKGVTKSISFPAKVSTTENNVTADANFNIDRTNWNLTYGNDKSLGDKFIYPEVNIQLHLVANRI